jgi:hypothetical protein
MSTNVVVFRTERIVPHLGVLDARPESVVAAMEPETRQAESFEEIDRGTGAFDRLAERLGAGRARWSQLTFYLLDPASWR